MKNFEKKMINGQAGFSLVELIVVVVVITIVATIAVSRFQKAIKASNEAAAVAALKTIVGAEASRSAVVGFMDFDQLVASGAIDSAFEDGDGNPQTAVRSGYQFLLTLDGSTLIISGIPASTGVLGSGDHRFGASNGGLIYTDINNLETHYLTAADLTSGTSVAFEAP